MPIKPLLYAASVALAALMPIASLAASHADSKTLVMEALNEALIKGDVDAVDTYWSPDHIQHDPMFGDGIEAQKGVVQFLAGNGNFKAEYARVIADGGMVAVHARYEGFGPKATIGFDVFRVEDGKIVEHWDNLLDEQPLNPSGRSQIDGATEITDLDMTEANKA